MSAISFTITHRAADCAARVGRVVTPHGAFDTPAFMPVGTQGSVKGLLPGLVADTASRIILANTYHLMLRPGSDLVARMGGLHHWTRWPGAMLTDSGGFQVFSLSDIRRITDQGVTFRSHLDGSTVELTPERSIAVQNELGADIIMALDDCPPAAAPVNGVHGDGVSPEPGPAGAGAAPTADAARIRQATERSVAWLERCVAAHRRGDRQALFGIVQGGTDLALRSWSARRTVALDLPGYAIGGVAVGEGFAGLKAVVEHTAPLLPPDKPRYLMGVGYERDILAAVRAGVDMFDCVLPTRNGRNAGAFTATGSIRLRNKQFAEDPRPIQEGCDCPACRGAGAPAGAGTGGGFSRSYLRHLFLAGEMLGPILVSLHNIRHFQRYLLDIRRAISDNDWSLVSRNWPVAVTDG